MNWFCSDDGKCVINPDKVEALKISYDRFEKNPWFLIAYTSTGAVHTLGSYDTRENAIEAMNNALKQINEAKA